MFRIVSGRFVRVHSLQRPFSTGVRLYQKTPDQEPKKEETGTKINIYNSGHGGDVVVNKRIDNFIKKKQTGLTDDESTTAGKVVAKSKDALSLALIGAGVLALAASLGTLYKTYFKKEPWDFCYEKAETILYASEDLQDHLGVDFKVTKYLPGQKNFGDKVVHSEITEIELKKPEAALSPAKFLEQQENEAKDGATAPGETAAENDNLYQTLMINAYIETTISKQILVQATFIKKKSESDSDWFPMVVLVAKDYKNQYKVKQILVCDNRKTIKTEGLDVARTKINADGTKNLSPYEKLELEEKKKTEELKKQIKKQEDEYELFNALGVSNSGSKTSGTNFADLGKIEGEVKQTSDTPSAESARLRPKF